MAVGETLFVIRRRNSARERLRYSQLPYPRPTKAFQSGRKVLDWISRWSAC